MTRHNHLVMRAALRIHDTLCALNTAPPQAHLPETTWLACRSSARKLHLARRRGWQSAAAHIDRELTQQLARLDEELAEVTRNLQPQLEQATPAMPPVQIYRDLLALLDEFEDVHIAMAERTVSAVTLPIELEGLYLGPFRIVLHWRKMDHSRPYEVIAVDPHPSNRDEDVVHPHVQGETLCEGEARLPIRQALRQGRLLDFFLIVRQTLETYSRGNAYVDVDEWNGVRCGDCDAGMPDCEAYSCECCSTLICEPCTRSCTSCDSIVCGECTSSCETCDQLFCSNCLRRDAAGGALRCQECQSDVNDYERLSGGEAPVFRAEEVQQATPTCAAPEPSILSDGVGEARASA